MLFVHYIDKSDNINHRKDNDEILKKLENSGKSSPN